MADGYISQIKTPDNKVYLLKDSEKTDEKVKQTANTEDKEFPILLKNTNNTTEETAGVKYSGNTTADATTTKPFTFNPSTGNLTVTQLKIGTKNDNMGLFPNLNNWNQIGSGSLYWYRSYINNYYGGRSHVDNWDSGKNIGTAANASAAAVLGTVNFYNTAAAGATQTKTLLTADSTANSNITITLPKTTGTLALKSELPTLSGLSGIGTINASGTAPLTLNGSKSGTTYTLTGSIADASFTTSGIVNTSTQVFGGGKTLRFTSRIYPLIGTSAERSQWYKITFPYSTITTGSSAQWFMNSFDLHFGGGYASNPSGVAHVTFYWTRAANNGAWAIGQQAALIEGILANKIGLYYRIAEPGVLYVNNTANTYNGIWIDNLYVDDTAINLNWSTITITATAAITESTSPKLSDYTKITTSYLYNDGGTLKTDSNFEGKYIKGTWLYTSAATAKTSTAKLATIESDNFIYYITPANALKSAIGTTAIGAAKTPIYWDGSKFTGGTALKDLAYKDSLTASDIPDLSGTYVKKVTSTDNAIVRFDGTGGQIQNSGAIIDDHNNISVSSILSNSYSGYNLCKLQTSASGTEIVIKTKFKFVNSATMPSIRIHGYSYGKGAPLDLTIVYYIYSNEFYVPKVISTGGVSPDIYLFTYTENSIKYVAIGIKSSLGYLGFTVDANGGALGGLSINPDSTLCTTGWTVEHNGSNTSNTLIPAVNTDNCKLVPYLALSTTVEKAISANLTSTTNAVAYYTDAAGKFGSKASANGALYATSANGALQWGTLPIAQGGTGKTSASEAWTALGGGASGKHADSYFALASHNHAASDINSGTFDAARIPNLSWNKITSDKPAYTTRWPTWDEVTGKPSAFAPSTHNHSQIVTVGDKRGEATTPNSYANQIIFQGLKTNSQIGSPYTDTYSYLIGLRGWSDSSGGNSHELAFNGNGIYRRQGATTTWGNWLHLLDNDNTAAGTNNAATLTWSTTYTIAKINGTDIKFTTMAKPSYSYSDISSRPTSIKLTGAVTGSITLGNGENSIATTVNHNHDDRYKIASGVITLGSNTITPVTSVNGHEGNSVSVTAADLGLSKAMRFIGVATVAITDGSTTDPVISGYSTKTAGDVIIDKDSSREYVWSTTGKWELLGGDESYWVSSTDTAAKFWRGDNTWSDTINGGTLKIANHNVTLEIGAQNGSWTHFTSNAAFYFNHQLNVVDGFKVYNTNTSLTNNNLTFAQGGGWSMSDSTWIRTVGSKSVYMNAGTFRNDGTTQLRSLVHINANTVDDGSWVTGVTGTAPTATTTDGTTTYSGATIGTSVLTLGNNKVGANSASGVANNSQGILRLYSSGSAYGELTGYTTGARTHIHASTGISLPENIVDIMFRPGSSSYYTHIAYETSGNEALVAATQNIVTSFIFVNGESYANVATDRWTKLTGASGQGNAPGLQIKQNCVSIGELIPSGTSATYKLNVNGTSNFKGNMTSTGNFYTSGRHISLISGGETDQFIDFAYAADPTASTAPGASWRIGALNSGSGDGNYFVIQTGGSATSATTWNNALRLGMNTYDAGFGGNVYPLTNNSKTLGTSSLKWNNVYATTFTGNLTGNVTGNVSGTAANVTGTVAVANGGTGATTAANARTNLGLGSIATYGAATAGTKDTWGLVPVIGGSDGVMEVGKYIDFHTTDGNTADYDVRITAATTGLTISGITTGTFSGSLSGNATSANTATSAGKWTTARTLTIGSTGKSVDGSGNVSWSLAEIGAAASNHEHNYIGNSRYVAYTADGHYEGSGTVTGYIKIRIPKTKSATMLSFDVDIYNYYGNTSTRYHIAGYNYVDASWNNTTAYCIAPLSNAKANLTVRFLSNGDDEMYVTIGETDTSWLYPKVNVHNIVMGHSGNSLDNWASGWTITIENTAFNTNLVKGTITNTNIAYKANAANFTSTKWGIAYYSDTAGTFAGTGAGTSGQYLKSNGSSAPTWATFSASTVGLGNVENTKLSTWTGSSNITTVGTITSGTWSGTAIANNKLANSSLTVGNKSISLGASGTVDEIFTYSESISTDTSWDKTATGAYYVASGAAFTGSGNPGINQEAPYGYGGLYVLRAGNGGAAQFYISDAASGGTNKAYGIRYRSGWNVINNTAESHWRGWATILDDKNYSLFAWKRPASITTGEILISSGTDGTTTTKGIYTLSAVGDCGWNTTANRTKIPDISFIAHWNGTYDGSHSNLAYYSGGKFGTMAKETAADYAKLASPALTGTPTAPTAANGTNTTQIATTEFVNNTLAYVNAMRFKGTLGTGGTITTLPASHDAGDTYRVITAGTWAGKYCEVGTLIICIKDSTTAADADWTTVETNEDGAIVGSTPSSSTDNAIVRWDGAAGRTVQNSTVTISDNGNVYTERAGEVGYVAKNTTKAHQVEFIVGDSGNGGIYDRTKTKWIVHSDTSGNVTLNGNANTATMLISAAKSTEAACLPDTGDRVQFFRTNVDSTGLANDGHIIGFTWSSADKYGAQIFVDTDPTYTIALRQRDSAGTWSTWKKIPMGDGTNASGTWGISISGSAATATTATNLSAAPTIASGGTATINLAANTAYTLTVGGKSVIFKTPADTNNAVTHTVKTTTKYYVTGTETSTTSTGGDTFDTGIYATTIAGQLNATSYKVDEKVTLQWNSTDSSLDFIFA